MNTGDARSEIMRSIRSHLAQSARRHGHEPQMNTDPCKSLFKKTAASLVEDFKHNLEAVDGRCVVVHTDAEIVAAVKRIVEGKEIAVSNAWRLKELIGVAEVTPAASGSRPDASPFRPSASRLFQIEVGVTEAQAGIAETGTLVLDSSVERNRLVSLVPPVHIAILDASRIYATLGETLAMLQGGDEVSPAITFVTGPSRTADIELTLAIGVHGPQELYVIVVQNPSASGPSHR